MLGSRQNMHAPSHVCVSDAEEKMINSSFWTVVMEHDLTMTIWMTSSSVIIRHIMNNVSGNFLQPLHVPPSDTTCSHSLVMTSAQLVSSANPILPGEQYKNTDRHHIWRVIPVLIIHYLHPVQYAVIISHFTWSHNKNTAICWGQTGSCKHNWFCR